MTTAEKLQRGLLSQKCPTCGIVEAAGSYSTCHLVPTGEADWFVAPPRGRHAPNRQPQSPETPTSAVGVQP